MIGLKLIRQRCNYTVGSFAKELGVSRQIISEWELGNKEIPSQRKNEISELLGISKELLGPITKEQKEQLINKAMFAYSDNGITTYKYKPPISLNGEATSFSAHFFSEDFEPELEKFTRLEKKRKSLIKQIDSASPYRTHKSTTDQILALKRDLLLYQRFLDCYSEIGSDNINTKYRVYYRNIFLALLDSVASAYSNEPSPICTIPPMPRLTNNNNPLDSHFKELLDSFTNTINKTIKETIAVADGMADGSIYGASQPDTNDKNTDSEWSDDFYNLTPADQIKCAEDNWLTKFSSASNLHMYYYVPIPRNLKPPHNND